MSPEQQKAIQTFLSLVSNEEFFEAHELMEDQWIAGGRRRGDVWHGLTQLAVALTHEQRGNANGAGRLYARALDKLNAQLELASGQSLRVTLQPVLDLAARRIVPDSNSGS